MRNKAITKAIKAAEAESERIAQSKLKRLRKTSSIGAQARKKRVSILIPLAASMIAYREKRMGRAEFVIVVEQSHAQIKEIDNALECMRPKKPSMKAHIHESGPLRGSGGLGKSSSNRHPQKSVRVKFRKAPSTDLLKYLRANSKSQFNLQRGWHLFDDFETVKAKILECGQWDKVLRIWEDLDVP